MASVPFSSVLCQTPLIPLNPPFHKAQCGRAIPPSSLFHYDTEEPYSPALNALFLISMWHQAGWSFPSVFLLIIWSQRLRNPWKRFSTNITRALYTIPKKCNCSPLVLVWAFTRTTFNALFIAIWDLPSLFLHIQLLPMALFQSTLWVLVQQWFTSWCQYSVSACSVLL